MAEAVRTNDPRNAYLVLSGKSLDSHAASLVRDFSVLPEPGCKRSGMGLAHIMMYLDLISYLPDDILVKLDRASMAVSLEARVPLLDHRVIEFAWRVPMRMKRRRGEGKRLLRQLLYRYVPRAIVDRPKMGFCLPLGKWLRGPLRDWAESLLDPRRLKQDGYIDSSRVQRCWKEHLAGTHPWEAQLWNVLMFQSWMQQYSRNTSAAEPSRGEFSGRGWSLSA
jgi:asparagine synthase (glutamine-hydrolysing)